MLSPLQGHVQSGLPSFYLPIPQLCVHKLCFYLKACLSLKQPRMMDNMTAFLWSCRKNIGYEEATVNNKKSIFKHTHTHSGIRKKIILAIQQIKKLRRNVCFPDKDLKVKVLDNSGHTRGGGRVSLIGINDLKSITLVIEVNNTKFEKHILSKTMSLKNRISRQWAWYGEFDIN